MCRELMEEIIRGAAEVLRPADLAPMLGAMQQVVGASQSLFFTFDARGKLAALSGVIGPVLRETYAPYYAETDPLQHGLAAAAIAPFTVLQQRGAFEVVNGDVYLASMAYHEVHAPHDLEHQLLVFPSGVRYGDRGMLGFLFTRTIEEVPFGLEDLRRLRALEPGLRAAARRTRRFGSLERERDAMAAVLSLEVDEPRAVFSDELGARWMNDAAARAFARLPELRVRVEEQARALRASLERPLDLDPPTSLDLQVGRRERASGELHVARDGSDRPLVVCRFSLVEEEATTGDAAPPRLTPTERVVLSCMTRGLSNKEIALDLGVSPETVRTHVKSIFRKLRVDTRVKAAMWAREHLPALLDGDR